MKLVFFDMEFANGKVPGSVYSLGYVKTNGNFELVEPQTDLLMNPECEWNQYVRSHILAYSMKTVKAASPFPAYYRRIKRLLRRADVVIGFAVKNDTTALQKDCERYGLKPISFSCLDLEPLCKKLGDYPKAHGLDGYVRAYCGIEPENRHRSDGDAYASMLLLKEICKRNQIHPKQLKKQYAEFFRESISQKTQESETVEPAKGKRPNRHSSQEPKKDQSKDNENRQTLSN